MSRQRRLAPASCRAGSRRWICAVSPGRAPGCGRACAGQDQDPVRQPRELVAISRDQQDGDALGGALLDDLVDLGTGTDVDALSRVVEHQHLRAGSQRPRHENLLLIAAGQGWHRRVRPLGDDPQTVDPHLDLVAFGAADDPAPPAVALGLRDRHVRADAEVGEHSQPGPLARDRRHAGGDDASWTTRRQHRSRDLDFAAVRQAPGQQGRERLAARPGDARHPYDLAGADGEVKLADPASRKAADP